MMEKGLIFFLTILFISMTVSQAGAQQATVQVAPASYTVLNVGLTFTVNITVQNVENLYGYGFELYYPNDVLNGTRATEGSFLKTGGISTFFSVANFTDNYNATDGLLNVFCSRLGNVQGVNGSGTLVTVTFESTSTNALSETLQLANVDLSDPTPAVIPSTTVNGEVRVIPEFSAALILPFLIISASAALILKKEKKKLEKSSIAL